ncbi:MAG: 1-deoxy-D-xylulose-5-phosphate reductoisomerase [Microbacter sp.]
MSHFQNQLNIKRIAILGSTGSIGTQALEVIDTHPDLFEIYALTANNNVALLIQQAIYFQPAVVVIANDAHYFTLKEALRDYPIQVFSGMDSVAQIAGMDSVDIVLTAMVGYSGLLPTLSAVKSGKTIALANKETLVVAGELMAKLLQDSHASIIPVDSEHSAIFQCLTGEPEQGLEKIILTASGGPFRQKTKEQLRHVTKEEALKHPNWKMGAKITIDSATMMNKGFEVIEARWLFGLAPDQIDVVIHPESIIHSMVQFVDGTLKAQMGLPDMRLPIQYAFSFPNRIHSPWPRLDFSTCTSLTFEQPDMEKFRNLSLAFDALKRAGNAPCVLNAANEVAVEAFLSDRISFVQISEIIEMTLEKAYFVTHPNYDDFVTSDQEARMIAQEYIRKI